MQKTIIRKFKSNDLEKIRHLQPAEWGDITHSFQFFDTHDFCHPIVAVADDRIVGTANGICNGRTSWLSHIIVDESFRRKGVGAQLTRHMMNHLLSLGSRTLLLIATDMGQPLYEKLGFETVSSYLFFKGQQFTAQADMKHIRSLKTEDHDAVYQMDRDVSGEDRSRMLRHFLLTGWIYEGDSSGKIQGYFLPDLGEGLVVADRAEAGIGLLKFKYHLRTWKAAVMPMENRTAIQFLSTEGFQEYRKASRMILGEPVVWQPQHIFNRTGGYYG